MIQHTNAAPAADHDLTDFTAAVAAADVKWSYDLGDPPSAPEYIQDIARTVWQLWVQPLLTDKDAEIAGLRQRKQADLDKLKRSLGLAGKTLTAHCVRRDEQDAEIQRLTRERNETRAEAASSEASLDHVTQRLSDALDLTVATVADERLAGSPAIPAGEPRPGLVKHIRPVKVSADRVEVEVSTRTSDGTTRAYVREWGSKGGCRQIGVILTDQKRAELLALLGALAIGSDTDITGGA